MGIVYSLDIRCQTILQMIMNAEGYVTIQELANQNHVSKRSIYYDIMKINDWLSSFNLRPIQLHRNKGVVITQKQIHSIKQALQDTVNDIEYLFTPTQRSEILICTILTRTRTLYIEDFITICKVSRNTIISDLKVVNEKICMYGLTLSYKNKRGYRIIGDFTKKISVFFLYFNNLIEYYRKGAISLENEQVIHQINEKLKRIEKILETKYVSGVLFALATFMTSLDHRSGNITFCQIDKQDIVNTREFELVTQYFPEIKEEYQLYVALHLLGFRLQTIPMDIMVDNNDYMFELAKSLVDEFCNVACIEFPNHEQVIKALLAHLKTSIYRYRYGIPLANPMLHDIKHKYYELFEITRKSCKVIERQLGVPLPESEIAYITLHFGGFMVNNNEKVNSIRILLICPNGVSTGNMLKAEIRRLMPQVASIDTMMLSKFQPDHNYDLVISTVEMKNQSDILVIQPILTDIDRVTILRRCIKYSYQNQIQIDGIMKIAKDYIDSSNIDIFKKKLESYFSVSSDVYNVSKQRFGYGMLHHLYEENIVIYNDTYNWQQAITLASEPLLQTHSIEQRYVESIVTKCNELGPYMFIANSVVLAHAGIHDGVHCLGVSLAKFNTPVCFNASRTAQIIFVLATADQVSHIRILHDIMTIFSQYKNIERLLYKNTATEMLATIKMLLHNEEISL